MSKKKSNEEELKTYAVELQRSFDRWDHIYKYGCSDPFHADGVNLYLIRNHIRFYKHRIEEIVEKGRDTPSLFPLDHPPIYNRPTPDSVPMDYMANIEGIRQRASEQFALYRKDENFIYILSHAEKAFPNDYKKEKEMREHGLSLPQLFGLQRYETCIAKDDLVSMRNLFREDYEKRAPLWAETADKLRAFLSNNKEVLFDSNSGTKTDKPTLDDQMASAKESISREPPKTPKSKLKTEQLTLF